MVAIKLTSCFRCCQGAWRGNSSLPKKSKIIALYSDYYPNLYGNGNIVHRPNLSIQNLTGIFILLEPYHGDAQAVTVSGKPRPRPWFRLTNCFVSGM
jgi:hypothetical protein